MLSGSDGLTVRGGPLTCARASEGAALEAAIAAAAAVDDRTPTGHVVSIAPPSGRHPFALLVAPLHADTQRASIVATGAGRRAAVLITVSDPDQRVEVLPERLSRLLGRTPAKPAWRPPWRPTARSRSMRRSPARP